jgi:SAM-dependent methyltransferase
MSALEQKYGAFYEARNPAKVYPVEFVVRAFLGNYPGLKVGPRSWKGKRVLDLGFGDGRNIPLFYDLGMVVYGVEISDEICDLTATRLAGLNVEAVLRVGRNTRIPFPAGHFEVLVGCHSCYYVDPGTSFSDNVLEFARVVSPGGRFVFSAPIGTSYIMQGAEDLGGGHMKVSADPYGIRNGCILKKFDSESQIYLALSPYFDSFAVGSCRNDFWGINEHVWIVSCERTAVGVPV